MKLSVIIVSYNVKYFLEQCLHSVMAAMKGIEAEVIVIDNASSDHSVDYLEPMFPAVRFIRSSANLGFGKANNLAWQQSTGSFVLFLNPDTIVAEDVFAQAILFFEQNNRAGAIGLRMIDGTGSFLPESKRAFPSASTAFYKAIGLSALFPNSRRFNRYALGYLSDLENHQVDVLAGAFMMVRRELLMTTGGFDEAFFMYGEDIDLSFRLQQTGFENWYIANTSIVHFKGESLRKWSADHVKVFYEAMIIFVKKHFRGRGAAAMRLMLMAGIRGKSWLSFLFGKRRSNKIPDHSGTVAIVSKGTAATHCARIISNADPGAQILFFEGASAALHQFCISNNIRLIVFCSDGFAYSEAMEFMQTSGKQYKYRFHAAGSESIVGSDDKSDQGEVLQSH